MSKRDKLVVGYGIKDIDYNTHRTEVISGKKEIVWRCPYYLKWYSMLKRCYSTKRQKKDISYIGCTVCDEWKYLSKFIEWVDSQPNRDWINCELDKDILMEGNKHYCPENVVFVSRKVNTFVIAKDSGRGSFMLGVNHYIKCSKNPFRASCGNCFTGKQDYLGHYPTELEAHKAWQARKHEYACKLADMQEDERVANALRERYAPDKDWTNK